MWTERNRSGQRHRRFCRRTISPPPSGEQYTPLVGRAGGEYDGADAAGRAGGGAIDPVAERSGGLARVDGIGGSAAGQYSPPIFLIGGGEYDGFGATG
jgi:hypothetical protein